MFTIKYCSSYYTQAISLSAKINSMVLDTCEIEEGKKGQFEVFRSGELFLSKEDMGRFPTVEDVDDMVDQLDPYSG
jgi:hypothetical protein